MTERKRNHTYGPRDIVNDSWAPCSQGRWGLLNCPHHPVVVPSCKGTTLQIYLFPYLLHILLFHSYFIYIFFIIWLQSYIWQLAVVGLFKLLSLGTPQSTVTLSFISQSYISFALSFSLFLSLWVSLGLALTGYYKSSQQLICEDPFQQTMKHKNQHPDPKRTWVLPYRDYSNTTLTLTER